MIVSQMFVVSVGTTFIVTYFVLPRSSPTLLFCFFFIFCFSEVRGEGLRVSVSVRVGVRG